MPRKANKRKRTTEPTMSDIMRIAGDMRPKEDRRAGKERRVVFETGATRCANVAGDDDGFPLRYDLLLDNTTALKRLARTFGEGSLKYPARNWMKGMPESDLLNHAVAHLIMHREGDKTEDHLAHATWNLITLMHMQEQMPDQLNVTNGNFTTPSTKG